MVVEQGTMLIIFLPTLWCLPDSSGQCFSKCSPQTSSMSITGNQLRMLKPNEPEAMGTQLVPPGNSDACSSQVKAEANAEHLWFWISVLAILLVTTNTHQIFKPANEADSAIEKKFWRIQSCNSIGTAWYCPVMRDTCWCKMLTVNFGHGKPS